MYNIKFIESILNILILVGIGFLMARKGIVKGKDTKTFSNLIFYITSPALILSSITEYFTREMIISSLSVPFFAILMTVITLAVAYITAKTIRLIDEKKRHAFYLVVGFCNTVFIGIPVITSVYGVNVAGYVFFFDLGASLILWTLGIGIASYNNSRENKYHFSILNVLKNLISPPLVVFLLSVMLVMLEIRVPRVILNLAEMLGQITIPLSGMFIGILLSNYNISKKNIKEIINLPMYSAILIRMILSPLILGIVVYLVDIPVILKKVITIEGAMPTMMFSAILAEKYEKHSDWVSNVVIVTTLFSVITIPLVIYLLEQIY